MATDEGSIPRGILYMLVLSVLLGWIPIVGPVFAGFVGGRVAGSAGRGFIAAILPAIVAGIVVFFVADAIPGVGDLLAAIFATALTVWIVIQAALVILGALLGGWSAQEGMGRRVPIAR